MAGCFFVCKINCVDNIHGENRSGFGPVYPTSSETCKLKENNAICTDSTCNEKYYTHPAFIFGSDELAGIWVGKFEVTGSKSNLTTKPGIKSVREGLKVFLDNIMAMNNAGNKYGFDIKDDTHMMKNMEWGAIAYLTTSKYGKQGNSMYTGSNKKIYESDSINTHVTGSNHDGACVYNTLIDRGDGTGSCGGGMSSTGNVYGIYDMGEGTSEYVMANMAYSDGSISITYLDDKYYDKYSFNVYRNNVRISKLGDALREVNRWDNNYAELPSWEVNDFCMPWLLRWFGAFGSSSAKGEYSQFISTCFAISPVS